MKDIEKTLYLGEIGSRIRAEREYLGLTREKFAEIVDLSPFYIGQIERGDRSMSVETLVKISSSLKISMDYILTGEYYDIKQSQALESSGDYDEDEICSELGDFIKVVCRLPKEKIGLIKDITKLILPHIK